MTPNVSQNKKHAPLVTPRYMLGTAKRGWPLLVLFFIMFMLIFTLPIALELSSLQQEINEYGLSYWTHERLIEELSNHIFGLRLIGTFLSASAAVFSGVYFMQFIQSKKSAGFFHSLPEKRSGHFISALFSSAVVYIAAVLPNFIFTLLIFAAHGFLYAELIPPFLSVLGFGLFYFSVFLSVAMLAGSISGNRVIHTIMTAFLLFALPVVFISLMLLLRHGSSYLDVISLAGSFELHKWLSPVIRAAYVLTTESAVTKWVLIAFDAIMTAVFIALAYFAYTKRPIERSGNPIVFAPLGEIVKYIIIGPSAVLLCELFDIFSDGWGIIGFAAGLLLSFMLCNTVINRSAKAMFSHMRGMAIYSVSFIITAIIISVGCFGIFDYAVPVASEITIDLSGVGIGRIGDITVSDPDDIKAVRQAMSELTSGLRDGRYKDDLPYIHDNYNYENSPDKLRAISMSVVYKSPLGFDIPYQYYDVEYDAIIPLIDFIIDSGLDKDAISWKKDETVNIDMHITLSTSQLLGTDLIEDYPYDLLGNAEISTALISPDERFRALFSHESDGYQKFSIGYAQLSGDSSYNAVPVFSDDLSKIKALMSSGGNNKELLVYNVWPVSYIDENTVNNIFRPSEKEYFDALAKTIEEILVYSHATGEMTSYTGDKIRSILPCLASVSCRDISVFTKTDSDYTVHVKAKGGRGNDKFPDNFDEADMDGSLEYYVTWFLEDQVPDFVK